MENAFTVGKVHQCYARLHEYFNTIQTFTNITYICKQARLATYFQSSNFCVWLTDAHMHATLWLSPYFKADIHKLGRAKQPHLIPLNNATKV
jgi:hypothetical protein